MFSKSLRGNEGAVSLYVLSLYRGNNKKIDSTMSRREEVKEKEQVQTGALAWLGNSKRSILVYIDVK